MNRKTIFLLLGVLMVLTLVSRPAAAVEPAQDQNLLRNPGFEGDFFAWAGIPEVQVAHEWTPWWIEDTGRDPRWHRPEWKRAVAANFPNRVKSGDSSQQWFTFYASHYAGMYQQVFDVTPGQTYRFSVWVQVWSSLEDFAYESVLPANPRLQIGIEPNGDARPGFAWSPSTVVWSGEASMDQIIDGWALISVEATANSDVITVYLRTNPDFANKHNDIYIDDASLIAVSGSQQAPPPPPATSTPADVAPTAVPPTATSVPPTATNTAVPTETATVEPTATATETLMPTETATATAIPTEEPPTETPSPTAEPPTETPEPEPTETTAPTAEATEIAAVVEDQPAETALEAPAADPEPVRSGTPWWVWVGILLAFLGLGAWGFQRGR